MWSIIFNQVQIVHGNIATWMKANKLSVNIKETSYIIFKPDQQKKISSNMSLFFDNEQLEQKQETKFQGVYIHENLCRKSHINFMSQSGKICGNNL